MSRQGDLDVYDRFFLVDLLRIRRHRIAECIFREVVVSCTHHAASGKDSTPVDTGRAVLGQRIRLSFLVVLAILVRHEISRPRRRQETVAANADDWKEQQ